MPFLGSVYQIFGLYPELYYGMISAELQRKLRRSILEIVVQAEAEE
ncbi:phosphonate ABC transporter permease [Bacillus cereus]